MKSLQISEVAKLGTVSETAKAIVVFNTHLLLFISLSPLEKTSND